MGSHPFDFDTAVSPRGDGVFDARIDRKWWIHRGPNGGYVAALILRGMIACVDDPSRAPRSLTVHYVAPPAEGAVELHAEIVRRGRSLTSLSARLVQDGSVVAIALGAFSSARESSDFCDLVPPQVAPAADLPRIAFVEGMTPPLMRQLELHPALGGMPMSGGEESVVGGWLRLDPPRAVDYPLLAMYTDAWAPAIFSRVSGPVGVPTIDLTIHFRSPTLPLESEEFCLGVFRTQMLKDGFLEEDGEIWGPDGSLLAHSRQLALYLPARV